jgi:hypothetical protein
MQSNFLSIRSISIQFALLVIVTVTFFFPPGSVEGASVVRTNKDFYHQGEPIRVSFTNAPGHDSDWICIVLAGSPDTDAGDYKYMPRGLGQGSLIFDPRPPGRYEVRTYYNYRRSGYVVSGRYAFSVGSDPVTEDAVAPYREPIEPSNSGEANRPPPIPFAEPPNVIVLPGTDVYVVPGIEADIFFQGGWWWRQWRGNWYRSKYYDHGWAHHRDYPSWHRKIPHDWRHNYSANIWGGRPWNPPHINHGNLNNHWRGGHWRNDHGLGRPGGVRDGRTVKDDRRDRRPVKDEGRDKRIVKDGGRDGHTVKDDSRDGRTKKDGNRDRRTEKDSDRDRRTHPDGRMDRSDGDGSRRGDRR